MSSEVPKRRYSSAKREAAAAETDLRILDAAFAVLDTAKSGEGFSLEAVARQAGVTRLTVHNRFGSRRALLEAAFDRRAQQAGLHRIGEAMTLPDAMQAIEAVIGIFCSLWAFNRRSIDGLLASGAADVEFRTAMAARNERRRHLFRVLCRRLVTDGKLRDDALADCVDMLFGLTAMPFYAALDVEGRSPEAIESLIRDLAEGLLRAAGRAS